MNGLHRYNRNYSFTPNNEIDRQIGFIVIHGFTSTTSSMLYITERLVSLGYHAELPTLSGHSTEPDDLRLVKWELWIDDVQRSWFQLRKRVDKIFLIGLSMGGTLALNFSAKIPFISGIVLINHALFMNQLKYRVTPFLKNFIGYAKGIGSDILDSNEREITYDRIPLVAIEQLLDLCKDTEEKLFLIKSPVLILKSIRDKVIPVHVAETTFRKLRVENKRLISLYNSAHVATQDFDKDIIVEEIERFVANAY